MFSAIVCLRKRGCIEAMHCEYNTAFVLFVHITRIIEVVYIYAFTPE